MLLLKPAENLYFSRWVVTKSFKDRASFFPRRKDLFWVAQLFSNFRPSIQESEQGFWTQRDSLPTESHGSPPEKNHGPLGSKTSSCHIMSTTAVIVQRFMKFRFLISCRSSYEWSADIPVKFPQWWVTGWEDKAGLFKRRCRNSMSHKGQGECSCLHTSSVTGLDWSFYSLVL